MLSQEEWQPPEFTEPTMLTALAAYTGAMPTAGESLSEYIRRTSIKNPRPMSRTSSDMDNCAEPGDVPGLQDAEYGCTRDGRARTMP